MQQQLLPLREACEANYGEADWGSGNIATNTFNNNTMICASRECCWREGEKLAGGMETGVSVLLWLGPVVMPTRKPTLLSQSPNLFSPLASAPGRRLARQQRRLLLRRLRRASHPDRHQRRRRQANWNCQLWPPGLQLCKRPL